MSALLNGLTDDEYLWLATNGEELFADANATVFEQGEPADAMTILLKGEIQVQRDRSGAGPVMFIGRAGQITGLLPFSRMKTWGGRGVSIAPTWAVRYNRSLFPRMLARDPLHDAARGQHFAGPFARSHAHGAAIGKADMRWASSPAILRTSSTIPHPPRSAPPPACCRNWRPLAAIVSAWGVFASSRSTSRRSANGTSTCAAACKASLR